MNYQANAAAGPHPRKTVWGKIKSRFKKIKPRAWTSLFIGIGLFLVGMVVEYKISPIGKITTSIQNAIIAIENITNPKEKNIRYVYKTVKYYEFSEEDLHKIIEQYVKETYEHYVGRDPMHVRRVADAYITQMFSVPHPEVTLFTVAMGKKESCFSMAARPPASLNSSAVGIGQIIYKWHKDKLLKQYPWRGNVPITLEMMATDVKSNIDAKYIVFDSYLTSAGFNYKNAVYGYFGQNHSDSAKIQYLSDVQNNYTLLSQRIFRDLFSRPARTKRVKIYVKDGEDVPDGVLIDEKAQNGLFTMQQAKLTNEEIARIKEEQSRFDKTIKKNYFNNP